MVASVLKVYPARRGALHPGRREGLGLGPRRGLRPGLWAGLRLGRRSLRLGLWAGLCLGLCPGLPVGLSPGPVSAQEEPVVIKMASLAPANSPWHDALLEMGARWRDASGGRVILRVYPGGQGGEEEDVLRRMRLGQFQAGGFTLAGLQSVMPSVVVLAIPMAMEEQDDLHRVRAAMGSKLEEVFLEKGYVLLHWADLGWMRFFVPGPDPSPDVVRGYTYVHWGDDALVPLWEKAGFHKGVQVPIAEVTVALETGRVEAINTAPLVVAGYGWFTSVPYMIDLPWAPLSGATLVDRRTWERIPEEVRPRLKSIAEETGEKIQASLREWEADAIEAMRSHGLQVVVPSPEVLGQWRSIMSGSYDFLRGGVIPADWFDEALRVARQGRGG